MHIVTNPSSNSLIIFLDFFVRHILDKSSFTNTHYVWIIYDLIDIKNILIPIIRREYFSIFRHTFSF